MKKTVDDCPACGASLNCSGCGEDIQNILEQTSFLIEMDEEIARQREKDAEIKRLERENERLANWAKALCEDLDTSRDQTAKLKEALEDITNDSRSSYSAYEIAKKALEGK